jgi:large subunit ribosomal protein L15
MSLLQKIAVTTTQQNKRVGRGFGSGLGGHTSGRGTKGQKARVGAKIPLWFEGGQLPSSKKFPMLRGKLRFNVVRPWVELTLTELNRLSFADVNMESLKLNKIIDGRAQKVKVIFKGELKKKLNLSGLVVTPKAKAAIEKAGGSVLN